MGLLALVTVLIQMGVVTAVSIRLLMLSMRTRRLPERLIALGFLALLTGFPLLWASRARAVIDASWSSVAMAAGLSILLPGLGCFLRFTRVVFRPDSTAARAAVAGAVAVLVLSMTAAVQATMGATTAEAQFRAVRPFVIAIVGVMTAGFGWMAAESLGYFRLLRRRMQLGLADAVTTDRFLLFGVAATLVTLSLSAQIAFVALGMPMLSPLPAFTRAILSMATSACWALAFLPPQRYLAWVEARAAA